MTEPDPSEPSPLPSSIAGYRIDRVLGGGGMSTVYLAKSPDLPQWAALKVLPVEMAHNPAIRARFVQEGDTTARLGHPNVVAIYGRGETEDGQLWIAMQYVQGTDAEAALQTGAMTPTRALRIADEVATALDYAHRCGVVHQDVKPSNILLGERGADQELVMLSDFGAALTAQSSDPADSPMVASVAYAAPEVILGHHVDGRADVYSLGCSLFRLLTDRYPFPGDGGIAATITAHFEQPPPTLSDVLPWADPELDEVIATALAKDPAQRFATAGAFAVAVTHALRTAPAKQPPPARPAKPAPPAANNTPTPGQPRPWQPAAIPTTPPMHTAGTSNPAPPRPAPAPPSSNAGIDGTLTPPIDFINYIPRAQHVAPKRRILVGLVGAGAAVIVIIGLVVWLAWPTSTPDATPTSNPPSTTTAPSEAATRLARALPAGYRAGTCTPTGYNAELAAAALSCRPNIDPGGPPTATYTLARNTTALRTLFDHEVAAATAVICPGNIQSPGPWRHLATPSATQGIVFCGIASGQPLLAWTNDAELLLARTQSENTTGSGLDQLYTWWSSHS